MGNEQRYADLARIDQVLAWRRSLSEQTCRSLATEWLRYHQGDDRKDAYDEFLARGYDKDESLPISRQKKARREARQAAKKRSTGLYE